MSGKSTTIRRGAAGALIAAAVTATGFAAAAPASAETQPNLRLTGSVTCDKTTFVPHLVRVMTGTNTGDVVMKNVTLQEINGQRKFAKELKSGDSLEITTTQPGCFPSSIGGYVISDSRENLADNYGFWYTLGI